MRYVGSAFLVLALSILCLAQPARAQAPGDIEVANARKEHPDYGVLFFDVSIFLDKRPKCPVLHAILKPDSGKAVLVDVNSLAIEFYRTTFHGALVPLQPGVWTLTEFSCYKEDYKGAIAQIKVEPGEIVNAGTLVVERSTVREVTLWEPAVLGNHAKVEDLTAESVKSLRERAPETFAKAKRKYFAINASLK